MGDSYTENGDGDTLDLDEVIKDTEETKEASETEEETETPEDSPSKQPTEEEPSDEDDTEDETGTGTPDEGKQVAKQALPTPQELQALADQKAKLDEDIIALRKERRVLRDQPAEPLIVAKKETGDELSDVAPEDVNLIEKVLKAKGYVRKDEIQTGTYQEKLHSYKDAWLEQHPEYLPENDPNDEKWNALNKELTTFYKAPENPKDITKILDRVHRELSPKPQLPTKKIATVDATKEKIKTTSKVAAPSGAKTAKSDKAFDRNMYAGFTEAELRELES